MYAVPQYAQTRLPFSSRNSFPLQHGQLISIKMHLRWSAGKGSRRAFDCKYALFPQVLLLRETWLNPRLQTYLYAGLF